MTGIRFFETSGARRALLGIILGSGVIAAMATGSRAEAPDARDASAARETTPESADRIRPLLVGTATPSVSVRGIGGAVLNLAEATFGTPTILIFYRGGWCPYCSRHLGRIQQIEPELAAMGYQILAVSPDRPELLSAAAKRDTLTYTLLSDSEMDAARAFGIAFRVDDTTVRTYSGYGIDLEGASGRPHHLLPVPSVFVIGTDGAIRFQYVNPNYRFRLDPSVLLAAARSALRVND
jgi:peroxiredoxin